MSYSAPQAAAARQAAPTLRTQAHALGSARLDASSTGAIATRTRFYLFLLTVALPIDFFRPTAILREGGARPAIPLMAAGAAWILWRHWPELLFHGARLWRRVVAICAAIGFLGTYAFLINNAGSFSTWGGPRSPLGQFLAQGALFFLIAPVIVTHAWLFSRPGVGAAFLRVLPTATFLHLFVIVAEALGLLHSYTYPLMLFRGFSIFEDRPSGLMTEPSYVGVLAAMYGLPLLLCMPQKRWRDWLLALATMAVALQLGGKTMIPALLFGLLAYAYQARIKLLRWQTLVGAVLVAAVSLYVSAKFAVTNVEANLSSAMRFGSTLLAWNVATAGYGWLGLGFGQFHFQYRPEYAPWFLMYSYEAQDLFHGGGVRASTYNLPIRFLVEEGVAGAALFFWLLASLFRHGRRYNDLWHRCGAAVAGAGLGYLFTQDPYFFPAFVCGAAILAAQPALG